MKIEIPDNRVITMEKLATMFAFGDHTVADIHTLTPDDIAFGFMLKDGSEGYLTLEGYAYHMEKNREDRFTRKEEWEEYDRNWNELVGYDDIVWGEDENGKAVIVHN